MVKRWVANHQTEPRYQKFFSAEVKEAMLGLTHRQKFPAQLPSKLQGDNLFRLLKWTKGKSIEQDFLLVIYARAVF